ncbi:hypothetical protein [Falsirhodobacter xinxiangensis]|uniref:hypothetical protein n=1 Tax=Falsirhodobacter xinxiangensis TaxID=2530049 RepID=UPI0010AA5DBC|nr:hypothetical protein [Rhodobacter xinxiangensis]
MRAIPAAIAAARAERAGIISHHLVWVRAKDRETGAASPIGFWTGDDHREFTVGGASRLYYGAGGLLALDQIVQGVGMEVRQHQISLSGIAPEVELAIRGYEVRLAPCEIHRAEFSTETGALLAAPEMVVDGEVDAVTITTPQIGGEATVGMRVLSNAALLTRPLAIKRSDESLRARAPNDAFLQYAKISGSKGDPWGAK